MSRRKRSSNKIHSKESKETKKGKKLIGRLQRHSEGYGFLIPQDRTEKDVFIPAHGIGGALNGDTVEAFVVARGQRGKREGKVVAILERAQAQLVGRFEIQPNGFVVICQNRRNFLRVKIPPQKTLKASSDQTVVVKITQYPDEGKPLMGEVVRILGDRRKPETETDIVVAEHNLRTHFPPAVSEEARSFEEPISEEERSFRKDLRSFSIVTIDGENARDFDDGILVQRIREGFRLFVAIADVSHFVRLHTPLDKEALARGTSVYFPDQCIPMLPEELSNHLCSLVPHRERLSFVAEMDFNHRGEKIRSDFYKAVIRSASRQTYTKVHGMMIDGNEELRREHASLIPHLEAAFELFALMRAQRLARGSIDFDLPEPQIVLDVEEGIATSIVKASRTQAHMLIEEFMVAANEAVAEHMADRKLPMIYRIHEEPDPEKLADFRILAHNLGLSLPPVGKIAPKDLAQLVREAKGKPFERLINTMLLRSLKQAIYSPENAGHFGLASKKYTHFTSPIRRYPDLIVHRLLHEALQHPDRRKPEKDLKKQFERLGEMAAHCSKMERKAMEAEWEVRDLHVALFMKDKVGEEYEGIVSSVTKFGFFVELMTYFVEGLVPLNTLSDDSYEFIEGRHELRGRAHKKRFRIGDTVRIQVVRVDVEGRKIEFALMGSSS